MTKNPTRSRRPDRALGGRPPLVAALLRPETYPHFVDRIELIETHISWVFLAGNRVYKIKKPVDLGFLDFTTLERRRHFCEEEVRLNRRLTQDVYLGVIELRGTRHRLRFGRPGRVSEVAVMMRRLPSERMLDSLVRGGAVDLPLMDSVATAVARFHALAETGGEIDTFAGIETVTSNWQENFSQTEEFPAELLPPEWRQALRTYVRDFLDRHPTLFADRVRTGRGRDCHGDLQAQHVCCVDPIQIFDCIEFNPRLRYGDTVGEIAFLAMDLDHLGRPDLAQRFLNTYLEETGDYQAVRLLDFYRTYRAYVRGKVLGFQAEQRPTLRAEARSFFELATRHTRPRGTAHLYITTGVMGTGKSTAARVLAERLGAIVIRTDALRKRLAGVAIHERVPHGFGEGLYSDDMGRRTYDEALRIAHETIAAGWPVIVDGSFSQVEQRRRARALAEGVRVPLTILWCDASPEMVRSRLRERTRDLGEISDGRQELLEAHLAAYEPPIGEPGVTRIDTTGDTEPVTGSLSRQLVEENRGVQ